MENKLQELTEKIYQEGLNKGNEEAEKITGNARKEADEIIKKAKNEAEQIIQDAEKKAKELKENAESELKLSSRQAVNSLKQQITDLISGKILDQPVTETFKDQDFVKKLIETLVNKWNPADEEALQVILPADKEKEMEKFISSSSNNTLKKGVKLVFDEETGSGFQIGPADGSYKISFTDEDFNAFFKDYLRPRLTGLLFEEKED
jgi:V/A-type H+-transporting ATPase subunit E